MTSCGQNTRVTVGFFRGHHSSDCPERPLVAIWLLVSIKRAVFSLLSPLFMTNASPFALESLFGHQYSNQCRL